ncbi:MAG: hypothetical protein IIY55_03130 [Blautia sp.]|nr:hypothetical protein [Blautia sp.]
MWGILYLLICFLAGWEIIRKLYNRKEGQCLSGQAQKSVMEEESSCEEEAAAADDLSDQAQEGVTEDEDGREEEAASDNPSGQAQESAAEEEDSCEEETTAPDEEGSCEEEAASEDLSGRAQESVLEEEGSQEQAAAAEEIRYRVEAVTVGRIGGRVQEIMIDDCRYRVQEGNGREGFLEAEKSAARPSGCAADLSAGQPSWDVPEKSAAHPSGSEAEKTSGACFSGSGTVPFTVKNKIWVQAAASFGAGTLVVTWALYIAAWIFHVKLGIEKPLLPANILVLGVTAAVLLILHMGRIRKGQGSSPAGWIRDRELFRREAVLYTLMFCFFLFLMFFVFVQRGTALYSGFTVFGDYAPHTAMIRSFSRGANYPTQYPHFGGEDVKYHFMFQFLVGNLEFLGLRLDWAYNVVSALAMTFQMIILGQMACRVCRRVSAQVFMWIIFLFPGGTSVFYFLREHILAGDLWQTLQTNTVFIGYTVNENWGLWTYNVYLNQRHLAFGILIVLIAIWLFWDWLEESTRLGLKELLFSKEAWAVRAPGKAAAAGILVGLCAFWNGAAVIGGLLVLAGFALFSVGKLDYLITAVLSVALTELQTHFFVDGSIVSASFYWGLLSEDKSLKGVLLYFISISGISVLGLLVSALFFRRRERRLLCSFLLPFIFAFLVSLTPDINVNHKYIMLSFALLSVLWGYVLSGIFRGGWLRKAAAVVLTIALTATGFYQFVVLVKDNDPLHRVSVYTESTLTAWLSENLTEEDLVLCPMYSMNEATMSGMMMYLGWPYYAWSAGYNTYYRAEKGKLIYSTMDARELKQTLEEEKIDYIIYEDNMQFDGQACREELIRAVCHLVFETDDGRIRIYETGIQE